MAGRKLLNIAQNVGRLFNVPDNASLDYRVGLQMRQDGETNVPVIHGVAATPWPRAVQPLKTLAHNEGIPRTNATAIVNNAVATLPQRWLYMDGVMGKSRG